MIEKINRYLHVIPFLKDKKIEEKLKMSFKILYYFEINSIHLLEIKKWNLSC